MSASPSVIECQDCGLFQHAPPHKQGRSLACGRCDAELERAAFGNPLLGGLCACGAFALLVMALRNSIFELDLLGRHAEAGILSGPRVLEETGFPGLGILVIVLLSVAPLLRFVALAWASLGARVEQPGPGWFLPLAFAHQADRPNKRPLGRAPCPTGRHIISSSAILPLRPAAAVGARLRGKAIGPTLGGGGEVVVAPGQLEA